MLLLASGLCADTLLIEAIADSPANDAQGVPRPDRGMSMEGVTARFGEPSRVHPAVGNPPITRWDYADYSVFFEYRHVLTSVIHR
jgi:hypothetical protein